MKIKIKIRMFFLLCMVGNIQTIGATTIGVGVAITGRTSGVTGGTFINKISPLLTPSGFFRNFGSSTVGGVEIVKDILAAADLRNGTLRAKAQVSTRFDGRTNTVSAVANLSDQVFFNFAPGMTSATLRFTMQVNGFMEGTAANSRVQADARLFGRGSNNFLNTGVDNFQQIINGSTLGSSVSDLLMFDLFLNTANLSPGELPSVGLNAGLSVQSRNGGLGNFANTATINVLLPQGVTIAGSQSGFFLTSSTAVPAPPAMWLFVSGLIGLIGMRKKLSKAAIL